MLDFLFGMIWKDFKFNIECCLQVHKVSLLNKYRALIENFIVMLKITLLL